MKRKSFDLIIVILIGAILMILFTVFVESERILFAFTYAAYVWAGYIYFYNTKKEKALYFFLGGWFWFCLFMLSSCIKFGS